MNDLVTTGHSEHAPNLFGRQGMAMGSANVGAVAIEQERAIAEAQGQLILAKRFPRSTAGSTAELMEACKSPEFAMSAFYSVPNRGSGPSIRFAEEVARCYGNFQYGHRELSRSEGKSEVEVYAWDMERNNRSIRQITVNHVTDTKNGPKRLTDQADIDNKIANVASKQVRGRILALMPKHMVSSGIAECKKTLAGGNDKPVAQRVNDMTQAFARFGVTVAHLEAHLGHKLDTTTIDELADLHGVYNAIREGSKPSDFFGIASGDEERSDDAAAEKVTQAARRGAGKAVEKAAKVEQPPAEATLAGRPDAAQQPGQPDPAHEAVQEAAQEAQRPAQAAEQPEQAPSPAQQPQAPPPEASSPAATAEAMF